MTAGARLPDSSRTRPPESTSSFEDAPRQHHWVVVGHVYHAGTERDALVCHRLSADPHWMKKYLSKWRFEEGLSFFLPRPMVGPGLVAASQSAEIERIASRMMSTTGAGAVTIGV